MLSENLKIEVIPSNQKYTWFVKCLNDKGAWYPSGEGGNATSYIEACQQAYQAAETLSAAEAVTVEQIEQHKKDKGYQQAVENLGYEIEMIAVESSEDIDLNNTNPYEMVIDIYNYLVKNKQEKISKLDEIGNVISETYNVNIETVFDDAMNFAVQKIIKKVLH